MRKYVSLQVQPGAAPFTTTESVEALLRHPHSSLAGPLLDVPCRAPPFPAAPLAGEKPNLSRWCLCDERLVAETEEARQAASLRQLTLAEGARHAQGRSG